MSTVPVSNSHKDRNNTLECPPENNPNASSSSLSLSHHSEISQPVNITTPENNNTRTRKTSTSESSCISSSIEHESKTFFSTTPITTINNTTLSSSTSSSLLLWSPRSQHSPSRMSGDFVECVSPSPVHPEEPFNISKLEESEEEEQDECGPLPLHTNNKDSVVSEFNINEKSINTNDNDKSKRETNDYNNEYSATESEEDSVQKEEKSNAQINSDAMFSSSPTQSCTPHTLSLSTSSLSLLTSSSSSTMQSSSSLHKAKRHNDKGSIQHHLHRKQNEDCHVKNSRKSKNEYLHNTRNNNTDEKMRSNTINSFTANEEQANVHTSVTASSSSNSVNNVKYSREKSHSKPKSSTNTQNNTKSTNEYTSTVSSLLLEPFPHSRVLSVCLVHDTLLTTHHSGICLYKEKIKKQQEVNTCHNKNTANVKCNDARVSNNNKALNTSSSSSSLSSPSHLLSEKETQEEEYYYYGYGVWELVETRNEMYCRDAYLSTPALYPTISQLPTCENNKNTAPLQKVKSEYKENVKSQLENEQFVTKSTNKTTTFNKSDIISNNSKDSNREMYKNANREISTVFSSSLPHPYARFFALACGNDHSGHSVCVSSTAGHFMLHHNLHNEHKIVALHFRLIPLEPLHTTNMISHHMKVKPLVISVDEIGQIALFDIDRNHYALIRNCPERVLTLMQQYKSNKNNNNKEETEKTIEKWYEENINIKENTMHCTNTLHIMHQVQDMEGFENELTQELLISPAALDALPLYQLENGMAVNVSCTGPCLQLCNECRNLYCGISGSDYYAQWEKEKEYINEVKDLNEYKCKKHTNTHNTFMAVNLFISCRGRDVQEYEEKELQQEETQKDNFVEDNTTKDIVRYSEVNTEYSVWADKCTTAINNEVVALDTQAIKLIAKKDKNINSKNDIYENNAHMYVNFIRVVWNGNRHCFALQEHSILHDTMPVSIAEHGHAMCVRYCVNNKIQSNMSRMQREYRNDEQYEEFLRSRVWLACAKMKWAELTSCTGEVKEIYNVNKVHLENEECTNTLNKSDDKDKCEDEYNRKSIIIQWIPLGVCVINSKRSKEMRKTESNNTNTKSFVDSHNSNSKNTKHVYSELEEHESQKEEQEGIMYDCVVAVTSELDILLLGKQVDASFLHEICSSVQREPGEYAKKEYKEQEELKINEEQPNLEKHNMKEAENHELEKHVQNKKEWERLLPNSVDAEAEEEKVKLEAWLAEDDNDSKDSHGYSQDEISHSYDDNSKVNAKEKKEEEEEFLKESAEESLQESEQEHVRQINMSVNPSTAAAVSSAKDVSYIDANNNCKNQIKYGEKNVVLGPDSKQGEDVHSASITVATTPQNVDDVVHKDHVSVHEKQAISNKTNVYNNVKCSCTNEENCKSTEITNNFEQRDANETHIDICTVQDVKHNMKCNNINNNIKEQEMQCYELIVTLYTSHQSLSMQSLKSHSATQTNMQNQKRSKRKCYNSYNTMEVMLEHKRSETHPSLLIYHHDTMSLQRITLPFIQFVVHASESRSKSDNNNVLYNTAEQNREEQEAEQHNSSSFLSLHPSELSESVKELMWKSTQQLMNNWMSFSDNKSTDNNNNNNNKSENISNKGVVNRVFASPASMLPSWSMSFHLPHAQQPTSSQFTGGVVEEEAEKQENKSNIDKEEEQITSEVKHKSDSNNKDTMFDLNIGRPLANLMFGWVDKSHMDKEKEINNKKQDDSNNTHYTKYNNKSHMLSTSNTLDTLQHPETEEEETECTVSRESKLQNTLSTSSSSSLYKHSDSPSPPSPIITQTASASASSCLPPSSEISSSPLKMKESNVLSRVVEPPPLVQTSSLAMAASSESLTSTSASTSFWSSSASPHSHDSHRRKNKKKKNRVKVISINLHEQNYKSNDDVLEHSLQSNNTNNNNIEDKSELTSHNREVKQHQYQEQLEELMHEQEQYEVDRDENYKNLTLSPLSFTTKRSDVESDEQSRHMKSARSTSLFAEIPTSSSSLLSSSALSPHAMDKCTVMREHNASDKNEHLHEQFGVDVWNSNNTSNANDKEGSMVNSVSNVSPEQSTNISHNTTNIEVMSSYLLMTQLCNVHEPIARHRLYSKKEEEFHTILLTCSVEEENVHEYEVHEHAKQKEEYQRKENLCKRLVLQDMFVNSATNSGNYSSTKAGTSSSFSSNKLTGASLSLSDKCHASSQFASQFVSWRTERMANHNKANLFDFNLYFHSLIVPTQIHELQERDKCKYELEDLRQVQQAELSALPSPFDVIVIYQNEEKASSSLLSWSVYDANDVNSDENEKNTKKARERITENQSWEPHRTFPFDDEAGQVIDLPRLNATAVVCDKFANYKNIRNYSSITNGSCTNSNKEEWRWATEQEVKRIENDESLIVHRANCGKSKQKMKMMMQSLNKDLLHWNVSPWEYASHWPSTNNSTNNNKTTTAIANNDTITNNQNNTKNMDNTSEHQDERVEKAKESVFPIDVTNRYNNDDNSKAENKSFEWSLQELPSSRVRRRRLERVRVNVRLLEQREKLITQHQEQLQALKMELGL